MTTINPQRIGGGVKNEWEKLCKTKIAGGLDLRETLKWNIAAICKLAWCVT